MGFRLVNTWKKPATATAQQRGFPSPGVGQTNNARLGPSDVAWATRSPYEGIDTWEDPGYPVDAQRGSPAPQGPAQAYRPGDLSSPVPDGSTTYRVTRQFSRGAQRAAPITGIVLASSNPGDVVPHKPRVVPDYPLGQYINNTIFWANQVIPTTVKLSGLATEDAIDAMLQTFVVYGKAQTL